MGFLISLGVEIARAIKNKKRDPDYDHVYNTTLYAGDLEDYIFRIDYHLRLKNIESAEELIEHYIRDNGKDENILKRVDLFNKLKNE